MTLFEEKIRAYNKSTHTMELNISERVSSCLFGAYAPVKFTKNLFLNITYTASL